MDNKLPTEVNLTAMDDFQISDELADRLNEEITNYLSDKYGFCVSAYGWELKATDIDWDVED